MMNSRDTIQSGQTRCCREPRRFTMGKSLLSARWMFLGLMLIASPAFAEPVPDTGQGNCYNSSSVITCPTAGQPFHGQDASYTINPLAYTKLDAGGNALPSGASSWVMVRDDVTGLIWEVKQNKDGDADYSDPHDADNTYSWDTSSPNNMGTFIDALNNAHFGGHSDWRIPSIQELTFLANFGILAYRAQHCHRLLS